jgi:hypothetical protein
LSTPDPEGGSRDASTVSRFCRCIAMVTKTCSSCAGRPIRYIRRTHTTAERKYSYLQALSSMRMGAILRGAGCATPTAVGTSRTRWRRVHCFT